MKYYTFEQMSKYNCSELCVVFGDDEVLSGEELINRCIDRMKRRATGAIWHNHRSVDRVCPETVGDEAYNRFIALLNNEDCDMSNITCVTDSKHVRYAEHVRGSEYVAYSRIVIDSSHVLFSSYVRRKQYIICDQQVTPQIYEAVLELFTKNNDIMPENEYFDAQKINDWCDMLRNKIVL